MKLSFINNQLSALAFLLLASSYSFSQPVFEPLHREVYTFMERLSQKGIVEFNDVVKPVGRDYIARKLLEAQEKSDELTAVDRDELNFLMREFNPEVERIAKKKPDGYEFGLLRKDKADRWRFFSYHDERFTLNGDPIYGQEIGQNDGESESHRWNGIRLEGYLTDYLAYSFDFRDNLEKGDNIDRTKAFSRETGVILDAQDENESIEYSETNNYIATGWDWGSFAIGKDVMTWGYAQDGNVVLSTKAPSFPFLRLDLQPAEWISFNYFHGWLESVQVDSSRSYLLEDGRLRKVFRDKYIASHTLTLRPFRGFRFAIGESMVYSDRLELAYLMPLNFYRLTDHLVSNRDNSAGDNAQFFVAFSSRDHVPNTHLFLDFFMDDVAVGDIFNAEKQINSFAWTIGASTTDPGIDNLTISGEYSRINPFVYQHFIPSTTYTSSNYRLGHWIGNNSDSWYGKLNYRIRRGVQASIWGRRVRNGDEGTTVQQYQLPRPGFLSDDLFRYNKLTEWGIEASYEIAHLLFLTGCFEKSNLARIAADEDTADLSANRFNITLNYGR
ncbi:MAG: capsule assembly Wzi family protein [Calditrichia bacterium]